MNIRTRLLIALFASGHLVSSSWAAGEPNISNFKGTANGTCSFDVSGVGDAYSGPCRGVFSTSKTKEAGILTLTSTISDGTTSANLLESFRFKKHSLVYSLLLGPASGTGSGTAHIGRKVISYFASFSIFGNAYTMQGTIRQTNKRLVISEVLSNGVSSAPFTYNLKRHVRK